MRREPGAQPWAEDNDDAVDVSAGPGPVVLETSAAGSLSSPDRTSATLTRRTPPGCGSQGPGPTLVSSRSRLIEIRWRIEYLKLNIGGHKLLAGDG